MRECSEGYKGKKKEKKTTLSVQQVSSNGTAQCRSLLVSAMVVVAGECALSIERKGYHC